MLIKICLRLVTADGVSTFSNTICIVNYEQECKNCFINRTKPKKYAGTVAIVKSCPRFVILIFHKTFAIFLVGGRHITEFAYSAVKFTSQTMPYYGTMEMSLHCCEVLAAAAAAALALVTEGHKDRGGQRA